MNSKKQPTIVVSGSFRKHFKAITEKIREMEKLGIKVLSPKVSKVVNPEDEFVVLETDNTTDPKILEQYHLNAIYKADALYIYNPNGYIGASTTMELGWAMALGKPIYVKEVVEDFTLKLFCENVVTPQELKDELFNKQNCLINTVEDRASITMLQEYIYNMAIRRGFNNETPKDIMLLMVEEIGELAKALRKYIGLKVDQEKNHTYTHIKYELADIFIYLLSLANACNIDLFKAFKDKEMKNNKRVWK